MKMSIFGIAIWLFATKEPRQPTERSDATDSLVPSCRPSAENRLAAYRHISLNAEQDLDRRSLVCIRICEVAMQDVEIFQRSHSRSGQVYSMVEKLMATTHRPLLVYRK